VNTDNIDEVIKMDTSQFIGVSDDGLYFKKGNLLIDQPEPWKSLLQTAPPLLLFIQKKIVEENERLF
jgi:dihydroorotase